MAVVRDCRYRTPLVLSPLGSAAIDADTCMYRDPWSLPGTRTALFALALRGGAEFPRLLSGPRSQEYALEGMLAVRAHMTLRDHVIGCRCVYPGVGYVELAM